MNNSNWLFFSFTLPAKNQTARMRVWRRLNSLGAVIIKGALYALPAQPDLHEQLTWLAKEVEELGGEALFMETGPPANMTSTDLSACFTQARDADWQAIEQDLLPLLDQTRQPGFDADALESARRKLAKRADVLQAIDYFPGGRSPRVAALLAELAALLAGGGPDAPICPAIPKLAASDYLGKIWLTRQRPYIDRLASFWLVRRFIDPNARIEFVPADAQPAARADAVRFDMAEAEFTHVGPLTTFEVLCASFSLEANVPARLREVIRAIDLTDIEAGPSEAQGVKQVLDGMLIAQPDDAFLTDNALPLFDALLASYSNPNSGEQK